jgi:hypothetical protein
MVGTVITISKTIDCIATHLFQGTTAMASETSQSFLSSNESRQREREAIFGYSNNRVAASASTKNSGLSLQPNLVLRQRGSDDNSLLQVDTTPLTIPKTMPDTQHATTKPIRTVSKTSLLALPTELQDMVLSNLDGSGWRALRSTHRVFKLSAQALIYREVVLSDRRPPLDEDSQIDAFLHILDYQPHIEQYVRAIRLRPDSNPMDSTDLHFVLKRLLPRLNNVQRLTICMAGKFPITYEQRENFVNTIVLL